MSKKLVALVLAFALVFSTFTAAFAGEALPVDAQAAVTIGMLQGDTSAGVTNQYLTTAPDRLQAAIMFLRLKGLEKDALAYTSTVNFADASTIKWAGGRNILAYLKAHPELGWLGKGGNLFDPNKEMEAKDYYKVMLETLGYKQNTTDVIGDFTYEQTIQFAASKGLTKVASVANFTVADLATATIEALKAAVNGTTETLAAKLVKANVINAQAAVAAGLYTPAPVALTVDSVKTDNLKQLVVKFNKEIKEAGDADNYSLETSGAATLDSSSKFDLQADKKTVVITLTHEANQQEVVALTVEGIEAADGSKITETTVENIELFDKAIPAAVKTEVVGNDTIKVTFSEPIATVAASNFKVDGGEVVVKGIQQLNNNTEVNVQLFSTLENGTVAIEVGAAAKDYAGFAAPKKSFTVNVVKDEAAPVVVGYKDATPAGITLIFNEDIELLNGAAANFYHTNTLNTVDSVSVNGKELTLNFTTNTMPEGTAYVYVAKEVVADLWDNENAKVAQTVEVTLDKTAPTVTKVEAGTTEKELVLTFSEKLNVATAQDATSYTILDKDGKEVANKIFSAVRSADGNVDKVTITFTQNMTGSYSIVIDGVKDLAGNAIAKVTKAFNISDVTAPTFATDSAKLYNAGAANQMLKVSFGEAMTVSGRYSVVDLEKYEFNGINLADVKGATIKAVDGNKAVEIVLPSKVDSAVDGQNFIVAQNLKLARVADAAGNVTAELVGNVAVSAPGTIGRKSVELTSKNTVVVTLLDKLAKFSASDFAVYADANNDSTFATSEELVVSRISHTINADGLSVVTFTLANNVATNGTTVASGFNVAVATKATTSENIYGEKLAAFSTPVADKAAPTVAKVDYVSPTSIVITFSEALNSTTFATGKNGFSVAGGTLTSAALTASNQVTLTGTNFTQNTDVFYTSVFGLQDANTNSLADIAHTTVLE